MALLHLTSKDYIVSQWSGGATTQVAIAPAGASYAERTFLWRVSSASVDADESDFTPLPDYHRWISTLVGEMTLSHNGGKTITLSPYEVHQFDGGADTHSWGRCTDFNLMLRKGAAQGSIRSLRISAGAAQAIGPEDAAIEQFPSCALLLFCGEGTAVVTLGSERVLVAAFEAVLLDDAASRLLTVEAVENTAFMVAEIWN